MARTVQGKTYTWRISDAPIGSGDAGEVYTVTCIDQPDLIGVMKKPAQIATGGTIQRQADQIAQESMALARLDGLPRGKAHPPRLLDQAPEFAQGTANYFIVSETAPGEDMASLLAKSRQQGKPFPRRVIITVLDALFDLFSRAHKSGVLWNDVKLDHIYWHNPSGQVTVIDWGNALFLHQEETSGRPLPPRWEDYQQMVDSLGGFLQRSAPELYADLGWSEFQGQALDLSQISILARRIAYQQQVVALKVMEYQSLIRVILGEVPSLGGLQKIQEYQNILEQIGATWEPGGILKYSQSLVESAILSGDAQTAVRVTLLVWEIFDDSLELRWHLLRAYFRDPDILSHQNLAELVLNTLQENWTLALWQVIIIAAHIHNPHWWDHLMPVLRQKALALVTPPPYQSCKSLFEWTEGQGKERADQSQRLSAILHNWRHKGANGLDSPFDYELLDLLQAEKDFPHRILIEIKKNFAAGKEAIRELFDAWKNADWDRLPQALQRVACWDPDRWGILHLSETLEAFQAWMKDLYEGPGTQTKIQHFIREALANRPPIERLMGAAPWLVSLIGMLEALNQGALVSDYQGQVEKWCPWLLKYHTITQDDTPPVPIDGGSTRLMLSHFIKHLKRWSDIDAGLAAIKENIPEYHPLCLSLTEGFQNSLSLNLNLDQLKSVLEKPIHPDLVESSAALNLLLEWRKCLLEGDLDSALQVLSESELKDWQILAHAHKQTALWHDILLPTLKSIQSFRPSPESDASQHQQRLMVVSQACQDLQKIWAKIYQTGLHQSLLETLDERIEGARSNFYDWRQDFEHTGDRVARLLYHSHLNIIHQISDCLLRLSNHIHQAKFSFTLLGDGNEVTPAMKIRSGENILDHLAAIEGILIPDPDHQRFPEWQTNYQDLFNTPSSEKRQQMVLSISDDHPLYSWLVQSIFAR